MRSLTVPFITKCANKFRDASRPLPVQSYVETAGYRCNGRTSHRGDFWGSIRGRRIDVHGRGHQKRASTRISHIVVSAILTVMACTGLAHAALGGLPEQFNVDGMTVVSRVSSTASNYVMRETTLATGTRVREYVSDKGTVFAISWNGPVLPNLKALLGKYFDTMVSESAKTPRAGRSQLTINLPEVVINSGGHMRGFEGSAWIPAKLPPGFTADDVH